MRNKTHEDDYFEFWQPDCVLDLENYVMHLNESPVEMMHSLRLYYFTINLCILTNHVLITEQECGIFFNSPHSTACDSFDDLRTLNTSIRSVRLELNKNDVNLLRIVDINSQLLVNIESLEISRSINNLTRDVFKNFVNLRVLNLEKNQISHVPNGVFKHDKLEKLFLDRNRIQTISQKAFAELPNLENLRLKYNRLSQIEYGVFNNLPIKFLTLSYNRIKEIAPKAFDNLPNLTILHLNGNQLTDFSPQDIFNFGNRLRRLWLHTNYLTELTPKMLATLANLDVLNLAFNTIENIEPNTFVNAPNLRTLSLSHNSLTTINSDIFPNDGVNSLNNLYLGHNRLTFLSSNVLLRLPQLKGITIGGNPWQCACLDLILVWLIDNNITSRCDFEYFNGKRPVCVVADTNLNRCKQIYDERYYQIYNGVHQLYPSGKNCLL